MEEDHLLSLSSSSTLCPETPNRTPGLKTELRLGLPGSESPERSNLAGFRVSSNSGGKRVFLHDVDDDVGGGCGGGRWALCMNGGGSEVDGDFCGLGKEKKKYGNKNGKGSGHGGNASPLPSSKAQMVGWPPIRSFRKNTMASSSVKHDADDVANEKSEPGYCLYVKVSMDGAPYLRKVDLNTYRSYVDLSSALETMFSCFIAGRRSCSNGGRGYHGPTEICASELTHDSDYVLTYEDKDGDWMLVGDVPWKMFANTCRRLRIMKGVDAIGLGCSLPA